MTYDDRYGRDAVADFRDRRRAAKPPEVELTKGLLLEHALTEFFGEVVKLPEGGVIALRDFDGFTRSFPVKDAFLVDGKRVTLVAARGPQTRLVSASGSILGERKRAQVARASRIFVEGKHDAELIEKVWGDDLREAAIVVELLDGVDHLETVLEEFAPGPERRAGILVDHLVERSKESRIAEQIERRFGEGVLILGHPFVDVWQAVKPARLGIERWPVPPRSVEWKRGVCQALGWPHEEQADIAEAWQRILSRVTTYRDLEPALSGQVEHLIDFVTVGHH
ncbi:DUF3097 family protein [Leucobacter sp. UCMA 4100]|uniref:DUF3097 family protein n=1 Tax=Leucobacter sp. UCMA 4100 TaxID=2810534 RepID=UPI0022EAA0ED|nr:DUF3097 family protein [Leucobacter sp. UCMA 4100]MDA3146080.1 DUF3097 family protein [Leucobacter sp. UCMA 4100]